MATVGEIVLNSFRESWTSGAVPHENGKRWAAPELMSRHRPSQASDVYAFGCVCIEVRHVPVIARPIIIVLHQLFTGQVPFAELTEIHAALSIYNGAVPPRPERMPDGLWSLINACWHLDPDQRPTMKRIAEVLSKNNIHEMKEPEIVALAKASIESRQNSETNLDMLSLWKKYRTVLR